MLHRFTDIVFRHKCISGEHYYKYDSENDRVMEKWPRLIKDDFGPKPGETEGIPDNIDSIFFDTRDKNIYFFKNDYVSK